MGLEHFRLDHPAGDDEVAAEADEMAANAVKAGRSLATTAKKSRASMKQCSAEWPPIDTNPWQTVTPTPCWPLHR